MFHCVLPCIRPAEASRNSIDAGQDLYQQFGSQPKQESIVIFGSVSARTFASMPVCLVIRHFITFIPLLTAMQVHGWFPDPSSIGAFPGVVVRELWLSKTRMERCESASGQVCHGRADESDYILWSPDCDPCYSEFSCQGKEVPRLI